MKKTLYFLVSLVVLVSCKKDNDYRSETRLVKKTNYDGQAGEVFKYDASGRIIGIANLKTNELGTTISYNGNEAVIVKDHSSAGVIGETEVRITFDSQGKPISRILRTFREYISPNTPPQRDYVNDTLLYEYDTQGLLKRTVGRSFDSTWFNPNDLEIQSHRTESVTDYSVSDGNLTGSVQISNVGGTHWFRGTEFKYVEYIEDSYSYEYSKQYPNKTDFSNAAMLNEFEITPFLLNKHYKNMADKITRAKISKDRNGVIQYMYNSLSEFTLEYDSKGFLSGFKVNSTAPDIKFYLHYQ